MRNIMKRDNFSFYFGRYVVDERIMCVSTVQGCVEVLGNTTAKYVFNE